MNEIFRYCVLFLIWLADEFGVTYEQINVVIFCLIEPVIFIIMVVIIYKQRKIIKKINKANNTY
jgi:hypothetical protein